MSVLARDALRVLLDAAGPQDEHSLTLVGNTTELAVPLTRDRERILAASDVPAAGRTALLDSIWRALDILNTAHHAVRALVVVSDGDDNLSRTSVMELQDRLHRSGAFVFFIRPLNRRSPSVERSEIVDARQDLLAAVERTGGMVLEVDSPESLRRAAATAGELIRNPYVLRYVGSRPEATINVSLVRGHRQLDLLYPR